MSVEKAIRLLTEFEAGRTYPELFTKVAPIIMEQSGDRPARDWDVFYQTIRNQCFEVGDQVDIAKVVTACLIIDEGSLRVGIRRFAEPLGQPWPGVGPFKEAHYAYGITLGLLEAAVQADEHRHGRDFTVAIPNVLCPILFNPCYGAAPGGAVVGGDTYEQRLGRAIKAFVRGSSYTSWLGAAPAKEARAAAITELFKALSPHAHVDSPLSPLSRLIIDQLCYAKFGDMSPLTRVQALALFMGQPTG